MDSIYEKCVEREVRKDGTLEIRCRLGLWSASGGNHAQVEREARRYWAQYLNDREYDRLLNPTP